MIIAAAISLFLCASPVQDKLPDGEAELLEYAMARAQVGNLIDGEQPFLRFFERFPSSARTEEAMIAFARLYESNGKPIVSRQWWEKLQERFPKSGQFWDYRLNAAQTWHQQGLWGRAVDAFRDIANETKDRDIRARAVRGIWSITGKEFSLNVSKTFGVGEKLTATLQRRDVHRVTYRCVRIPYEAVLPHLNDALGTDLEGAIAKVAPDARTVVKEWTENYTNNDYYVPVEVSPGEAGIYVLEGEHDGVTASVTLYSSKYGLIAKTAAEKLVCFVQDRVTSRPIEGATIRVMNGERGFLGTTDQQGLFVTKGFLDGLVVAQVGGELVYALPQWGGADATDPLVYVVTDRPIYRPGQTVHFRIVHRDEQGRELRPRPGQQVLVRISYTWNSDVSRQTLVLNEFGSAEGEFVLGDSPYLGEYTIRCSPVPAPGEEEESWEYARYSWLISNTGTFRVDEYRKPEFKVQVAFKKPSYVRGEPVQATGKAEYFFGGPVSNVEFSYRVYFRRSYGYWPFWSWYFDWYVDDEEDSERGPRAGDWLGDQVASGSGGIDKDGKFSVDFAAGLDFRAAEEQAVDGVYTVVVEVADLSRRISTGAASCRIAPAEFGLAMTLDKYVYRTGDPIRAKVRAVTLEDKPVPGAKVLLRAFDQNWDGNGYQKNKVFEAAATTDASGLVEVTYTPDFPQGYLYLEVESHDSKNRRVVGSGWAWVTGYDGWGTVMNWNDLEITPDKKAYEVGDTARLLVTSRHKNITLLLTLEGSELHHHRVVTLKGHTALIDLPLDDPKLAPNATVALTSIREQEVVQSQKSLVINPAKQFLSVEIRPDKTEYRPREKARYEIRTRDAEGHPVRAEVMLGIVDESIYSLQDEYVPDIRKHFIHRRHTEVATATSLHYTDSSYNRGYGRGPLTGATFAMEEAKADDAPDKPYADTEIRSRFADTAFWRTVTTDAQGRATIDLEFADNLTTWRATARAHTVDSRFGQEKNLVLSRKNVIVRVETPRFLTQNDETVLSAVIHNNFPDEKELKIEFAAEGVEIQGDRAAVVRIPAGGQKRFDWKASARDVGTAKITAKALGREDSDAMEVSIPVLPHGRLVTEGKAGLVDGRVTEQVVLPADAIPNSAELTVTLSPVHASMVLDALDSLAGYPYGCVEQTMSRFLPTVAVSQALKKLGIAKPKLEAELPRMVSAGLQRLAMLQQGEGGWGWWGHGEANGWITAYVVTGLVFAHEAGHPVAEDLVDEAVARLWIFLENGRDVNESAYILSALSAAYATKWEGPSGLVTRVEVEKPDRAKAYQEIRDRLAGDVSTMKPYAQALMAMVLHREGKDARPALALLAKGIRDHGTHAWIERGPDYGWLDDDAEASAVALRAFLLVDPNNPLVPKLANGLSLARRGTWWTSTRQTAMAVFALVDYLALTGEMNPDMTLALTLNGEKVLSERVTKANWAAFDGVRKFPASRLKPGKNVIEIERTGVGSPSYSIVLRYRLPQENIAASQGGLRVERRYHRIRHDGEERKLVPIRDNEAIASGEEIEVTLTLMADNLYEWLMVEDPLPAGFEPVREYWGHYGWIWNYWYDHKEFHDDRVSIAMGSINRDGHTVSYTMRAETPGDFHALPARIFNMYRPEVGGHSAESRVRVVERK